MEPAVVVTAEVAPTSSGVRRRIQEFFGPAVQKRPLESGEASDPKRPRLEITATRPAAASPEIQTDVTVFAELLENAKKILQETAKDTQPMTLKDHECDVQRISEKGRHPRFSTRQGVTGIRKNTKMRSRLVMVKGSAELTTALIKLRLAQYDPDADEDAEFVFETPEQEDEGDEEGEAAPDDDVKLEAVAPEPAIMSPETAAPEPATEAANVIMSLEDEPTPYELQRQQQEATPSPLAQPTPAAAAAPAPAKEKKPRSLPMLPSEKHYTWVFAVQPMGEKAFTRFGGLMRWAKRYCELNKSVLPAVAAICATLGIEDPLFKRMLPTPFDVKLFAGKYHCAWFFAAPAQKETIVILGDDFLITPPDLLEAPDEDSRPVSEDVEYLEGDSDEEEEARSSDFNDDDDDDD